MPGNKYKIAARMLPVSVFVIGGAFMGKHLDKSDRIRLETLLNAGHGVEEIAKILDVHRSTIYREIKRGEYTHRNSDYTEETRS